MHVSYAYLPCRGRLVIFAAGLCWTSAALHVARGNRSKMQRWFPAEEVEMQAYVNEWRDFSWEENSCETVMAGKTVHPTTVAAISGICGGSSPQAGTQFCNCMVAKAHSCFLNCRDHLGGSESAKQEWISCMSDCYPTPTCAETCAAGTADCREQCVAAYAGVVAPFKDLFSHTNLSISSCLSPCGSDPTSWSEKCGWSDCIGCSDCRFVKETFVAPTAEMKNSSEASFDKNGSGSEGYGEEGFNSEWSASSESSGEGGFGGEEMFGGGYGGGKGGFGGEEMFGAEEMGFGE